MAGMRASAFKVEKGLREGPARRAWNGAEEPGTEQKAREDSRETE